MKTYTFLPTKFSSLIHEARCLYHIHTRDLGKQVGESIYFLKQIEQRVEQALDIRLEERKILIIGPGQGSREMAYFGMRNQVEGIDLDVIAHGLDLRTYGTMLRRNGLMRTVKTVARKCLGLDYMAARELKKQLGLRSLPAAPVYHMDATRMEYPDDHFDFVYSFSVFEHIPDPGAAIREVARVLKPGGGCYLSLHLFSSETGCHDPRVFANDPLRPPYWAHLRPKYKEEVHPNAYLNELRLGEWHALFREYMPGARFDYDPFHTELYEQLTAELRQIRAQGELQDYTDQELLSVNLIALWRKEAQQAASIGRAPDAIEATVTR